MAEPAHGLGGLKYDPTKKSRPPEMNVFFALIGIVIVFEILNRLNGTSFLFNMQANVATLFNQ